MYASWIYTCMLYSEIRTFFYTCAGHGHSHGGGSHGHSHGHAHDHSHSHGTNNHIHAQSHSHSHGGSQLMHGECSSMRRLDDLCQILYDYVLQNELFVIHTYLVTIYRAQMMVTACTYIIPLVSLCRHLLAYFGGHPWQCWCHHLVHPDLPV